MCITGEGWSSVMYMATGVTNDAFTLYFLLLMVIEYMFMTQARWVTDEAIVAPKIER